MIIFISSGQALFTTLKLRSEGLVPAASARRACATSTPLSSARQTFPSGLPPAVKDCFGLHGHSAFGYVANRQIGVGRKSVASDGHTTDPFHSLQAGKTVDISRCASEINRLSSPSALPRLLRSLRLFPPARPAAGRLPDTAGHRAAVVVNRIHRGNIADSVRCHQSERRWLLDGLTPIGVPLPYIHSPTWTELPSTFMTTNNKPAKNCLLAGNDYYELLSKTTHLQIR